MELKAFLALRYEQTKRLAPAISLLIQAATLSSVLYGLLAWRGVGAWVVPGIFVLILCFALGAAWLYYDVLGMREHERAALLNLDPMQQDRLTPKERLLLARVLLAFDGDPASRDKLVLASTTGRLE